MPALALLLCVTLAPPAVQRHVLDRSGPAPSVPFAFLENKGQLLGETAFVGRLPGVLVRAEPSAVGLQVRSQAKAGEGVLVRLEFEGASPCTPPRGERAQPGIYNFFYGNDPSLWATGVRAFDRVRYRDLYPGIDLVLREEHGALEYDVIVAPGVDLAQLVVRCLGVDGIEQADGASLLLHTPAGPLRQLLGKSWEVLANGERRDLSLRWRLLDRERFGFDAPDRDPSLALVIDPGLLWSTYIGGPDGLGTGDVATAVAYSLDGDVFVVGKAEGLTFPMTPGTYQHPNQYGNPGIDTNDTFVARFRGTDGALVYSSKIGGKSHVEWAQAVAVDGSGRATVAGMTSSVDFPTTPNAFDPIKDAGNWSAFVLRLSPLGDQLEYSTFLEGVASGANAFAIGLAASGSAIVGGEAGWDFPVTPGAFSTTPSGITTHGFLTRLDPTGSSLEWSTYIGQGVQVYDLVVGNGDVVTITGAGGLVPTTAGVLQPTKNPMYFDAYALRMNSTGSALIWSTYLGGKDEDVGWRVALTPSGGVVVAGPTYSSDFPTTPGAFERRYHKGISSTYSDSFISRLDPLAQTLGFSTYLGSDGPDEIRGLAVDRSGVVTVSGSVASSTFPTTPGAYFTAFSKGRDLFVTRLDPAGSKLFYSTYIGGPTDDFGTDIALNASGRVTVVGTSYAYGPYPTTPGAFSPNYNGGQRDGVVTTLDLVLEGVELVGSSTPACLGPIQLNATRMPAVGDARFGFYCSGAPPSSQGWLVAGEGSTNPIPFGGASVWLNLGKPLRRIPITTNAEGYAEVSLPLNSVQTGNQFSCQALFQSTPTCGGAGAWSASQAVSITVQ
jgi:hypothetical protein